MERKPTIVILFDDPRRAQELADRVAEASNAVVVSTGDELYRMVNERQVDLLVIEHELKGFLTGFEILERLCAELIRPAMALMTRSPMDLKDHARSLGIQNILDSESSLSELKDAVENQLATVNSTQVMIPAAARNLVKNFDDIQPLPQLLIKLSSYMNNPDVSPIELAKEIAIDPKVTIDLLKIANSSSMGFRRRITKVADAVNLLGVKRTISLVLSSSALRTQASLGKGCDDDLRNWYNRRSVLVASTAATFAQRMESLSADSAYLLGLFQDLGVLVLAKTLGDRYIHTVARVRSVGHLQLHFVEKEDYKMTHADVSAAILQKWGMQDMMFLPVIHHHSTDQDDRLPTAVARSIHTMRIGEAFANLIDDSGPHNRQILNRLLADYGDDQVDRCKSCLAEAVAYTVESSKLFSLPVPDEGRLKTMLAKFQQGAPPVEMAGR